MERTRLEDFVTVYSNSVQLEVSPWDFKFVFGEIKEASPIKLSIRDLIGVYMSPQHAKVFADVLNKNLKEYEEKFGKIPGPSEPQA